MESNFNQEGVPRPSYVFSADPIARPSEINFDGIKLDLSHEFSLVAPNTEANSFESKDYLQVCLRIRPFTQSEKELESEGCVHILDSQTVVLKEPQCILGRLSEKSSGQMAQKFSFSKVFGPATTQKEFFQGCIMQPVKDLLKGQSRLIFTYGLTNSGKTYTFQGTEENIGILPRTLNVLFDSLQERLYTKMNLKPHRSREYLRLSSEQEKEEIASKSALLRQIKEVTVHNDSDDTLYGSLTNSLNISEFEESIKDYEQANLNMANSIKFSVWVSFFEIYNEYIYDLFVPVSSKFQKRKMLRLSQDVKGYSFIKDLQWIQVSDSKEAYRLLKLGIKHQSVAFTKLNNASSRSHSIFTVKILQIEDSEMSRVIRVSELSLCDLAGSERTMKTQNEGERLRETGNINTSLLTLGKCINVLKNSEKSKFQQHVPFRESKLTHYFQSFFNGKGKICMIVNISQCYLAYDETLNVLKFSAIAQKVCVPDTLNSSQEKLFGPVKSSQDVSLDSNSNSKILNVKRATISWENSLEDLMEDEDLVEELENAEETQNVETKLLDEDLDKTLEENKAFISHEEKRKLLDLIEDLKKKLINEKKEKLTLEFKIREEVTQEFTQYWAQREADFKETLLQEREILEENAERRLAIFKDLVGKCDTREEAAKDICATKVETEETHNYVGFEDIIDSLQDNVADIKKQAEIAHLYIASLPDPQEATACLELKFNQIKAELAKTKGELIKTKEELKKRENESDSLIQELETSNKKIITQNQRIKELINIIDQKEDTINEFQNLKSHMENTFKCNDKADTSSLIINNKLICNETVEVPKDSKSKICSERKRVNENELQQDEPPAKKGSIHVSSAITEDQKKSEEVRPNIAEIEDIRVLQENNEGLRAFLLTIENELKNEKEEKAELNKQIVHFQQELSLSEKKNLTLSKEVQQIQSNYDIAIAELHVQKSKNQEQEEKIMKLSNEIETATRSITNNVSQIKLMHTKIDELRTLDSVSQISNIDLLNLRDLSNGSEEDNLPNTQLDLLGNDYLVSKQVKEYRIQEPNRENSFHSSIEAIWEECKEIVKASSKKSHQIEELEQQIEKLQAEVKGYKDENNRLKEKEHKNQDDLLKEKETLIQQLKEELQEKNVTLDVQIQHVVEGKRALSELTQGVTCYKAKIKELETILETQKVECSHSAKLEQDILEKESIILKLERNLKEFQEHLQDSVKNTKDLNVKELKLKEEITQLTNNLQDMKHLLQLKEEEEETNRQETEKLKEELSASSARTQNLKADLQRKEEDYADLKEKLTDAKKQIKQVQKEVSVMRDEDKLLRIKINELEKKKNQCSQELDMKQRTIQQLKEQLNNQKVEEAIQQYERACKDLNVKEKIIEDMRMTLEEQEQTQVEQDQVLEAKLEEVERLATELEKWKEKCNDLETKNNQRSNKEHENNTDVLGKLTNLQDELQESEQKYNADRKKWLEEKMMLITQAKEAENIRNKEMKKYAEDRERFFKQQNEMEILTAQLTEKDSDLQKWREERDQLVAALEIQLKALISSNVQKDNEIEQLKRIISETSKIETQIMDIKPKRISSADPDKLQTEPLSTSFEISRNKIEDGSVVLDSCEVSTENDQSTRFPKPELEIQFTPLQPNKMAVKHPGCTTPVTVKIPKARKRKSNEMEEDLVKCENKKNATPRTNLKFPISDDRNSSVKKEQKVAIRPSSKKTYSLRSQASIIGVNLATKKKEGTLQKFGDFLQHSPSILQSKAKKIIETMSSSKLSNVEASKENVSQPKRAKRKLYTSEISSPIDISGQVILMDQKMKESDHQIIKRRLRTKTAK
ncbi:kinesin family member 20B [Homo sapiens]|uniref:Kinesin-like protein KIF20B n=1 Tax=Homo sapiens TaxID=9606 RepID=KI20B_HUMAN|nr:kinesin-like protein KIF20B isoform 1 [Homo sapiens]Q96Q89.3 RecName: Full=Kinesin-like protein KIF20B; AltName: Full=Cancer/testis antigen 90; Short=CT90; AltName: Full=Kinesin family member 20B; AltName: Full=Kinesin-related motor interacting with PIN1; AltName: Full=M-phase phosphoprotein 1; Short=MPP1 [Homo sapiens]KAI2556603.1 kinesin family member 20B [Homo sapiens]KAI4076789.1 kinesin family member 20B [Homo sapiens]|eukprot:NP_001271188.1 kinesin-like protein KIF20B isoform 1 [Homo sapiens]